MTTAPELRRIALAELHASPLNPRKHYDELALKQLSESLAASGQITPITVRPSANGKGGYELAAGHRRTRAALLAGLTHLDAVVRDDLKGNDPAFIEILNVENLQRDDLHPLEEAQGFRTLMEKAGYDIPKIAGRIGKSTKYVYDRLKLLQLIKPAQKLFAENEITAGHAILLARLSPKDQERAIGDNDGRWGKIAGLFTAEYADEDSGELDLPGEGRKPVSVREFQAWINDHVRFLPEREDLPNLFPQTLEALHAAKEEEIKVIKITRDYRVSDEAKDPKERTYGEASWKRSDGKSEPSRFGRTSAGKTCEHSVMGIVVAGPGRGEAFKVCVNKDTCKVHWATEQKEKAARAKSNGNGGAANAAEKQRREDERRRAQQKAEEIERARWTKALPALRIAVGETIARAGAAMDSPLAKLVLDRCGRRAHPPVPIKGKDAESVLRVAAYSILTDELSDVWRAMHDMPGVLKLFGLDAQKIVDQVALEEKPAQTSARSAPKMKPKKLAGDIARAKMKRKRLAKA